MSVTKTWPILHHWIVGFTEAIRGIAATHQRFESTTLYVLLGPASHLVRLASSLTKKELGRAVIGYNTKVPFWL